MEINDNKNALYLIMTLHRIVLTRDSFTVHGSIQRNLQSACNELWLTSILLLANFLIKTHYHQPGLSMIQTISTRCIIAGILVLAGSNFIRFAQGKFKM